MQYELIGLFGVFVDFLTQNKGKIKNIKLLIEK